MALIQITEPGVAVDPHQRKRGAGVDLGTTHSLIAVVREGSAVTLPDAEGRHLLPSVVRYQPEAVDVGHAAVEAARQDPLNTIASAKRLMGRGVEDIASRNQLDNYQFSAESSGMVKLQTISGEISPVQVSAEILTELARRGEQALAGKLDGIVVTVPAYFDEAQRQATRDAAAIAGIPVLRLLNEPTAAAIAYGLDSGEQGIIAIYDLGGGTFDISLLNLQKGVFEVLATAGDTSLGGDDFDESLVRILLNRSQYEGDLDASSRRALLLEAKAIKEDLSRHDSVRVDLNLPAFSWSGTVSRSEFEQAIQDLVESSIKACRRAIRDAGLTEIEVKQVVLVGGSTRVPLVRRRVESFFGFQPLSHLDPDKVVALGAAIQADVLVGNKPDEEMLLLDVLPLSLGLETMGSLVEKVIPRNSPIPVSRAQEFTTSKDGQTAMLIHVLQGERELVADCRSLARFELRGIPPMVAGAARIEVVFQVDADGLLFVSAEEVETQVKASIEVKPTYGLDEAEITSMLRASVTYAREDVEARMLAETRVEAQGQIDAVTAAIAKDGDKFLDSESINELNQLVEAVGRAILGESVDEIESVNKQLGLASEDFAAMRMDASVREALAGKHVETVSE
ncbi:MAG: Fe-S protein assembly chaperone HscA [Gammaproteobacteria bacterium]|jgi:molecular chaperone HscA|nr:Fe-S protein assembly chaperone HscA [Gammaproteobacteria bacterium]MBT5204859.1 Fe-S protein assembly chaperone HscA [Gammaproteobacteria bacterium]MBT5604015.1 Fe-S protein assembly chaperone HscA [Gammaproteobacteria bacterium]MBT6246790.1 Fe-S protein assembly chaperone HscA [Gammaproteobacteria bacterium]